MLRSEVACITYLFTIYLFIYSDLPVEKSDLDLFGCITFMIKCGDLIKVSVFSDNKDSLHHICIF